MRIRKIINDKLELNQLSFGFTGLTNARKI